jgi:hypothetical protein
MLVIIEVQKAYKETNLIRFRQYLGAQYSNKNNYYLEDDKRVPYPIFSIYILGYTIGLNNEVPILKVSPKVSDYTMNSPIEGSCLFTASLHHETVIVQTPVLKKSKRSLLEGFLSNFIPEPNYFLEVGTKEYDRKYVSLIKRLHEATMKKEIVEFMQRENEAQEEWEEMVRSLEKLKIREAEERKQKEEERQQKEEERKQKEEERRQKEEALCREEKARCQIRKSVSLLLELGLSKDAIAEKLNIPLSQIE